MLKKHAVETVLSFNSTTPAMKMLQTQLVLCSSLGTAKLQKYTSAFSQVETITNNLVTSQYTSLVFSYTCHPCEKKKYETPLAGIWKQVPMTNPQPNPHWLGTKTMFQDVKPQFIGG